MQKVKFINSVGEIIQLGITPPFILQRIEGTGGVNVDVQTEKSPYLDGASYLDSIMDMRPIVLRIKIVGNSQQELFEHRRLISKIFNPKLKVGVIEYETPLGTKIIEAASELPPTFSEYQGSTTTALINLLCPIPFWFDKDDNSSLMKTPFPKLFSFPLRLSTEMGEEGNNGTLINAGDVPTPPIFEIKGKVTNPKIMNLTTGEYLRIKKTLEEDETIYINTSPHNREITLIKSDGSKANAFGLFDFDSELFMLATGENKIRYISDNHSDTATLTIKYHNRYVGL